MTSKTKVFLAYDERMMLHHPPVVTEDKESPDFHHERPSRLLAVYQTLMALEERLLADQRQDTVKIQSIIRGDLKEKEDDEEDQYINQKMFEQPDPRLHLVASRRFIPLDVPPASRETICRVHTAEHYDFMKSTGTTYSDKALAKLAAESEDLYFCRDTFGAALLAVGGCVTAVEAVTAPFRESRRAMALVRPPSHHATRDAAMGELYRSLVRFC